LTAKEYIQKALISCQRALEELEQGDKRKSLGSLDFAQDRITAAKWTLINEIKDEEGEL
jgi:hypothetical protein